MMRFYGVATVIVMLAGTPALSQTTIWSTDKKSKTKSTTHTNTWQNPDGSRRTTDSTTKSKSKSSSIGVGVTLPPLGSSGGHRYNMLTGAWNVTFADNRGCTLSFYQGNSPGTGGGAASNGCGNTELASIGNWTSPDNDRSLTLTKFFVVPVATLQRTGPQRFDGTLSSGARVTIWR